MRKGSLSLALVSMFFAFLFTPQRAPAESREDRCMGESLPVSRKGKIGNGGLGPEEVARVYGKLPLRFERNRGQTDDRVKFLSRGSGYTLFLMPSEAVLALRNRENKRGAEEIAAVEQTRVSRSVLRMLVLGANRGPRMEGLDRSSGKNHYFIGSDPEKWRTSVSHYGRVRCVDVYPGIDLVYYGKEGRLEYDFVVSPGADPTAIHLRFNGMKELNLDDEGNLVLAVEGGHVVQHAPIIYQELNGQKRRVPGGYLLKGNNEVAFQVAGYDARSPLVIDPILGYSTYLGGSMSDRAAAIAVDNVGSAYVTGWTFSTDFPEEGPSLERGAEEDVFVTKLNRFGTDLVYSTFLGGDDYDHAQGIAVDSQGSAYITGYTKSTDFPVKQPFQSLNRGNDDAFVAKLSADGSSLIYSTYLGGRESDRGAAIAVDAAGRAYVTGYTLSDEFPIAPLVCAPRLDCPYQNGRRDRADVFVTKFDAQGDDLVYSTYLGGNDQDTADAIALDDSGRVIVAGTTLSTDFPTEIPIQVSSAGGMDDGFVTKLDSNGHALIFSTYLGGSNRDSIQGLALDSSTNIYVAGTTSSNDFPTTPGAFSERYKGGDYDVFVARLRFSGTEIQYSTYLGGESSDVARGLAVTDAGNACVTGYTESTVFPTLNAIQADKAPPLTGMDGRDVFVTKLNRAGSALLYSTYLGGEGMDYAQGIAMDELGHAYVTGLANSADFPTAPPRPCIPSQCPFQAVFAGGGDVFISRIDDLPAEPLEIIECSPTGNAAMTLTWTSEEGRTYSVLQQYDLTLSSWYTRTTIVATGETTTWTQENARTVPQSFYKIVRTE
jgi:hypothetical protein